MLDRLDQQPPDALLALIKLHDADPRTDKIDLGVGVYRTGQGDTPVFAAIKQAEARLVEEQDSKSYLGPEGDMGFVHALMPYAFGTDGTMAGRLEGMQTPGGTGAVDLTPLAHQNGLFSMLPLTKEQVERLRTEHAIYMAGSGRINVAGLHQGNIGKFVEALADVTG